MITKPVKIEIKAKNEPQAKNISELIQWVCDNVAPDDIEQLLTKVEKKPSLVKTALILG